MTEREAAPARTPVQTVKPDWIDYNGHMNVACYLMAFDHALDQWLDGIGIGPAFVAEHRMGPYALQTHMHFLGELMEGERFFVRILMLDCDARRFQLFLEMVKEDGVVAATMEQVTMNVDLTTRRGAPYPDWAQERLAALRDAHAGLARPPQIGAPLGLRRR